MANIASFFNKSSFAISALQKNLDIKPNVAFSATMYIADLLKENTATAVSSTFKIKTGRTSTVLTDDATWTPPATQTAQGDLLVTVSDIVSFVPAGDALETTVLATASSTLDVDEATVTFTIDDTTNYDIDATTGDVTLTATGAAFVNAGNHLPAYVITATSDTGATGGTISIVPLDVDDTVAPYILDPMWPISVWTLTATIADAQWDETKELLMDVLITDDSGEVIEIEYMLVGGES